MAYDSEFVRSLTQQEPQLKRDTIFNYLTNLNEEYVYIDQLAVKKLETFIGSISACRLTDKLKEMADGKLIVGFIPHNPWKNHSSIKFFTHQEAKLCKEISSKDKIVFGVYTFSLT